MANSVQKPYIGISGIIGAGKTTLSKKLGEVLDLPVYLERIDEENGLLGDFYKDKKKYSFPLQIFLLNRRFEQQQQVIWNMSGGIQDRTIYEDGVFAKMLMESGDMEERDYQTYKSLFSNMSNFIKKPDIILHLDVTPEQAQERIRTRGRRVESDIPLEYLQSLHKGYEEFLYSISKTVPVIRVKWSTFIQAEDLAKLVSAELANLKRKTTDASHNDFLTWGNSLFPGNFSTNLKLFLLRRKKFGGFLRNGNKKWEHTYTYLVRYNPVLFK